VKLVKVPPSCDVASLALRAERYQLELLHYLYGQYRLVIWDLMDADKPTFVGSLGVVF